MAVDAYIAKKEAENAQKTMLQQFEEATLAEIEEASR